MKQKFNQASWNYPEETEILVIGKPNKQKTDWVKIFDENCRFDEAETGCNWGTDEVKDFISNLLQQQREDFKQTMANSNEWWNNKLRQQRRQLISEILELVKALIKGRKLWLEDGSLVPDFGVIPELRQYNQALVDIIKILEKK